MIRRRNRYSNLRKHKRDLKKKYLFQTGAHRYAGSLKMLEDLLRDDEPDYYGRKRNHGFEYWQGVYLSGRRRFAKNSTNRVIRAKYRSELSNTDDESGEDIPALRGADYQKAFDYNWTIW